MTAALTGLLVPWITTRWEQRDKAVETRRLEDTKKLEVKTGLVREIGTSSARFLANVETVDLRKLPAALDGPYRAFEEANLDIGSQLTAYVPDPSATTRWRNFAYTLRNTYQLFVAPPGRLRNVWVARVAGYLGASGKTFDGLCNPPGNSFYEKSRRKLVFDLQLSEARAVAAIVAAQVDLTSSAPRQSTNKLPFPEPSKDRQPCNRLFVR